MPTTTNRVLAWLGETMWRAGWAPVCVFLINRTAMGTFGLGRTFPAFDIPMHLLGGAAIAFFFLTAFKGGVQRELFSPHDRATHAALVLGWTSIAALAWELYEWFSTVYLRRPIMGDVHDTLGDLVLGLSGGAMFLVGNAAWRSRKNVS
jgi:hypothetical protein